MTSTTSLFSYGGKQETVRWKSAFVAFERSSISVEFDPLECTDWISNEIVWKVWNIRIWSSSSGLEMRRFASIEKRIRPTRYVTNIVIVRDFISERTKHKSSFLLKRDSSARPEQKRKKWTNHHQFCVKRTTGPRYCWSLIEWLFSNQWKFAPRQRNWRRKRCFRSKRRRIICLNIFADSFWRRLWRTKVTAKYINGECIFFLLRSHDDDNSVETQNIQRSNEINHRNAVRVLSNIFLLFTFRERNSILQCSSERRSTSFNSHLFHGDNGSPLFFTSLSSKILRRRFEKQFT